MKKFYMFSFIFVGLLFLIPYIFIDYLSERFLGYMIYIILFLSIILIPSYVLRTSYFKFYENKCKYGLFIRFTTNYNSIKAICISDNWVRIGGKLLHPISINVKTKQGRKDVLDAFVSTHSNDQFSKILNASYFNKLNGCFSVHRKSKKKFNSLELTNMRSYIAGFTLKRGIDFYKIFKDYDGKVFIKRSIYDYHKVYLDLVFKKSNYNTNKIIFIEDDLEYDDSINLDFYYKKLLEINDGNKII